MATDTGDVFRLHLMRHAHAAWPAAGTRDFDRPLDQRGRAEALDVARQAHALGLQPRHVVASPAQRCLETAAIFTEVAGGPQPHFEGALYSEGVEAYLAQIRQHRHEGSLLLVGHNPMIEGLASMLMASGPAETALAFGYPTAGLLSLEFASPLPADLLHKGKPIGLLTAS
ncbi:histidine phosphatase family protein [Rhizobium sp. KVB221]|uniref:Histidine phosphatase family protein n=1 Tax=Rhizobium setariae TaxID=2801340 RepID=A0A937CN38_9HYPH|nr:histidine phosphatase family protein [Rhizobium setariae]MBL0375035.1 histidine phosphatase family protein [Rhizobium setariae]